MLRFSVFAGAMLVAAGAFAGGPPSMPHYDVTATLNTARGYLSVDVTIIMPRPQIQGDIAFLLGGSHTITSAKAGPDAAVEVVPTGEPFPGLQKISVRPNGAPGATLRLRIRYAGPLYALPGELPINRITPDAIELGLDSIWLPVRAGFPSFTASADIGGVPAGLVAVAPGTIKRTGGHLLIRCETGDPDLAFVAIRGLKRKCSGGFELYSSDGSPEAARVFRKRGAAAVKFLEAWFGRMPGRPARVVLVHRARNGYVVIVGGDAMPEKDSANTLPMNSRTRGGRRSIRQPRIAGSLNRSRSTLHRGTSRTRSAWALGTKYWIGSIPWLRKPGQFSAGASSTTRNCTTRVPCCCSNWKERSDDAVWTSCWRDSPDIRPK